MGPGRGPLPQRRMRLAKWIEPAMSDANSSLRRPRVSRHWHGLELTFLRGRLTSRSRQLTLCALSMKKKPSPLPSVEKLVVRRSALASLVIAQVALGAACGSDPVTPGTDAARYPFTALRSDLSRS